MSSPRRVFYGWYVVAAALVITTTTSGLAFYNLSILLAAFVAERGFPVALASSATATRITGTKEKVIVSSGSISKSSEASSGVSEYAPAMPIIAPAAASSNPRPTTVRKRLRRGGAQRDSNALRGGEPVERALA